MPKFNHDNMTKTHGDDKAEIPRHSLLQLHFQAHELIPTSLGCISETGKHLNEEFLVILVKSLEILNPWKLRFKWFIIKSSYFKVHFYDQKTYGR